MNTRTPYKGLNCTYQNILYDQVRNLANYIMDKQAALKFSIPEIQIKRNDDIDLRDRILNMTIEERRRIGLRKNTLWAMRQNILAGKKIKVYSKVIDKFS